MSKVYDYELNMISEWENYDDFVNDECLIESDEEKLERIFNEKYL